MKQIFVLLLLIANALSVNAQESDHKTIAGIIKLKPRITEAQAVSAAKALALNPEALQVHVRQSSGKNTFGIDIRWQHKGDKTSFQLAQDQIVKSIKKELGDNSIAGFDIASSVTRIKN